MKSFVMVSSIRRFFLIALVLLLGVVPALAQSGNSQVRFVHAIPSASAVDVYTDGVLTISNLAYGAATNYVTVPAGAHHIAVTQTGSTTSLWEQDINPDADAALTLVASSASQAAFQVYQDDLNSLPLGKARFTAIHAIADGASVDVILADGRPVIPGLQYNQPYGTLDLPATTYDLAVVPAGEAVSAAILPAKSYNLATGTSYVALVYGTKDAPEALLLSAPTRPEVAGGFVRIAHVIPDAPAVDIYLNNTLIAPGLGFGNTTDYIALPAASYTIAARAVGASTDLATGTLNITVNGMETALVGGSAEAPTVQVFEDVTSAINATTSVLSLINVTTDATVTAAYSNGTALLGSVASGKSDSAVLQPSENSIVVSATGGDTSAKTLDLPGGIYGGVYYSVIVAGGAPQVIQLPAVSLAQGVASAPGAQVAVASVPTAAPTEVAQLLPTATLPAPVEQPTQDTGSGVEILVQPTPASTTEGPTARVLVDPGVNLQLRQYPNSTALSLGLAPSGATLRINGRAGDPVPPPATTATPTPDGATPSVDLVTLLQPGEDLDPRQTWLSVTFDTPDGGTITAWVNALYVGVHDAQGKSLALRNLATVPSNSAGSAQNTAIQPPSPQQILTYAIATNVSPGVRIHIRRTPDTAGESLALVPAGTQMELVGVIEARDWVFVRYASPDSTVTGWVSVTFVTFQRNGQAIDFDRLQELNELNIVDDTQRGGVFTTGQPANSNVAPDLQNVVAGEVTGLNADANLHLRRTPSEAGESLALLPNGTTVIVTGRIEDSTWIQVTYQNQTGWVSSEFVKLTFNGEPYDLATLSAINTPTPTASPTTQA
ncbi:MAG: DUF4397 domain-containing protein [Chloroflexota bacterium]